MKSITVSVIIVGLFALAGCGGAPFTADPVTTDAAPDGASVLVGVGDDSSSSSTDAGVIININIVQEPPPDAGAKPEPQPEAGSPDSNPVDEAGTDAGMAQDAQAGDAQDTGTQPDANPGIDAAAYPYCNPGSTIIVVQSSNDGFCRASNGNAIVTILGTTGPVCVVALAPSGYSTGFEGGNLQGRTITETGNIGSCAGQPGNTMSCTTGAPCSCPAVTPDSSGSVPTTSDPASLVPLGAVYYNITAGLNTTAYFICY